MNIGERLRVVELEMRAVGISLNRLENEINHLKATVTSDKDLKK